jgi:hypothetical protein
VPKIAKTTTVEPEGVGRKDYSTNVEYAVSPLIRSWQSPYNYQETIHVPAGATVTKEIDLTTGTVVILYDFSISSLRKVLLQLFVDAYGAGPPPFWRIIFTKTGYQKVTIVAASGFPFFTKYRVRIRNYGVFDLDTPLNVAGIETAETEYYLKVV